MEYRNNKETGRLEKLIFCRRIRRGNRWIYPKKAKFFRFWVSAEERK